MSKFVESSTIRKNLLKSIILITVVCFIVEFALYLYYKKIHYFHRELRYLILRVLIPSVCNVIITLVSILSNKSQRFSSDTKNYICSICLVLLASSISINHAFFISLWTAPTLVMFTCVVFDNKKLLRVLLGISIVSVICSVAYLCYEYPLKIRGYALQGVVAVIINVILYGTLSTLKKYNEDLLSKATDTLQRELEAEKKLHFDYLTGVFSKEYIVRKCMEVLVDCDYDRPASFSIIDIDDFKSINDQYGHKNGDIVLKEVGEILRHHSKQNVYIGRFGGEEFIILQVNTPVDECKSEIERIRIEISALRTNACDQNITISGGLTYTTRTIPFADILSEADRLLYVSKKNGKNRISY